VAVEFLGGNIASQIGGDKVQVTAIISSPDTDPLHDYEPTSKDSRNMASAKFCVVNGAGFTTRGRDGSLGASPSSGRKVLWSATSLVAKRAITRPCVTRRRWSTGEGWTPVTADLKEKGLDQAACRPALRPAGATFKPRRSKRYNDLRRVSDQAAMVQRYAGGKHRAF